MSLSAVGQRPAVVNGITLLVFVCLTAMGWVGYVGSDDVAYAYGAYGWIENGLYVGEHGTIRYTITLPMALFFLVFGENEVTMALPTLIYGAGLIVLIGYMARRDFDLPTAAIITTILVTNPILVVMSSTASVDTIEAFFIFMSLFFFHRAATTAATWPLLLAAGAMAGLGFLTRETTVFFLLFYGMLFLFGYGIARLRYFIMAAGFLAVWLAEVIYLALMTGDPLYRINISLHHDSTIDRTIDLAGNVILHPLIDPLLVVLVNQEFAVLFWIAIPCGIWLATRQGMSPLCRSYVVLFGGLALFWFVAVGAAHDLLPLNPRYFLVSAIGASVLVGLAIHRLAHQGNVRRAMILLFLLVLGNLAGIYVENRNYMFGEKTLAEIVRRSDQQVYTDPTTLRRAELLLRWDETTDQVLGQPPASGNVYVYNPLRADHPNPLMSRDVMDRFQPQPDWRLEDEVKPDSNHLTIAVLHRLGLDRLLPDKVTNALGPGHPGVRVYRLPE